MTNNQYCAAKRFVYVWEGPVRITHWINVFSIIILSLTGYYIHKPFIVTHDSYYAPYIMGNVRYIHYLTGVIFSISVLIRLYWLFVGNQFASWRSFANPFKKEDRRILFSWLKYYTFLEKNPIHTLGHNPVALMAYIVLFNLFIFQIISGFALWAQANPDSTLYALTSWIFYFGGNQWIRFFHHLVMFLIWGFFINHIYSAVLSDFKTQSGEISSIFAGWKPQRD
ncbi:MAG: Ni/Fe-hydrogenase, b-type cytochrome subunit [Deferribacterales bacterium]